ncbi:MAG TPA: FAD-dependent oxidoreductase [Pyrinomonadaceae bacterium]|nr:FAD-dependent oxidoreductase [Pyrinomonadaceae bacterium]
MAEVKGYDVAVVGAGVFGSWTAFHLQRRGARVILLDGYGPGNSRASSGGESRIMRLGYGRDRIYTDSAHRSLKQWLELFSHLSNSVSDSYQYFRRAGMLWLARDNDDYCEGVIENLQRLQARCERLDREQLESRYPQINFGSVSWAVLENDSGVIMARRAVRAVVNESIKRGVKLKQRAVKPLNHLTTVNYLSLDNGEFVFADKFVFACGPWLPKLFPDLLPEIIHVTKQEVFFFGTPPGDSLFRSDSFPAWIDFNDLVYGIPNLDERGFKIAIDAHGDTFDPDTGQRIVSQAGIDAIRRYVSERFPILANAPIIETRVCQYENTSSGDFLIDRHPDLENVWLAGGGSGHGFKHGPAVGEYISNLLEGGYAEPRFSLNSKERLPHRQVF